MPQTLQEFLVGATKKAAADLEAAVLRVPEDKRSWSPMDTARSALNQAAECAILTGYTADLAKTRVWSGSAYDAYDGTHATISQSWDLVKALLDDNLPAIEAVIRDTSDEDLDVEIAMPWSTMTLAQVLAYPYWNMSYHEGQINYIASMLGCL